MRLRKVEVRPIEFEAVWREIARPLRRVFDGLCAGSDPWPLYLWGQTGVGKTYACLCLRDRLKDAAYLQVDWLCAHVICRMDAPDWLRVREAEVAILDELGVREKVGDLELTTVKRFADLREHKPAIYVSNHAPKDVAALYDDRIASRILCGTVHELTGPDRRFE